MSPAINPDRVIIVNRKAILMLAFVLLPAIAMPASARVAEQAADSIVSCREANMSKPVILKISTGAGVRAWREWDVARLAWSDNQCESPAEGSNTNWQVCDFSPGKYVYSRELQLEPDTTGITVIEIDRISGAYVRKGWYIERGQRIDLDAFHGDCEKTPEPNVPKAKL